MASRPIASRRQVAGEETLSHAAVLSNLALSVLLTGGASCDRLPSRKPGAGGSMRAGIVGRRGINSASQVNMGTVVNAGLFSLLPEPKSRWREFSFSYGIEVVAVSFVLTLSILRPQLITETARYDKIISLVPTPPPVNHQPAPVRIVDRTKVVAQFKAPIPDNFRLLAPKPRPAAHEEVAPKIELAAGKAPVLSDKPVIPRQLVRTNVFSTGSSAAT